MTTNQTTNPNLPVITPEQTEQKVDTSLVTRLGRLGAFLTARYQRQKNYPALDLTGEQFAADAFREQGAKLTAMAFGSKLASLQGIASKVLSNETQSQLSDVVYDTLATWAQYWAKKELMADKRFAQLAYLDEAQKQQLAADVSNQNRAWATMGGLGGFFGLKGVVLDTAWLMVVSLKSVYQLAMIYNKPLTGKDGVRLAYGVLALADLSAMQEKQVVSIALALVRTALKNAQTTGLKHELKSLGLQYHAGMDVNHIDKIDHYINLDRFNKKWIASLLPVVSVMVMGHYNNQLIEEVLGVAQATFGQLGIEENQKMNIDMVRAEKLS